MKKKKMIYIVVLFILIGFVFFVYQSFNGNPLSKYMSQQVLKNYLLEQYPDKEFNIREGFYDFKFSEYVFNVVQIGAEMKTENEPDQYEFRLRGFLKPKVSYDGIYYENLDTKLMEKLSREAAAEITTLLKENISTIKHVEVYLEILTGKYDKNTVWDKKLKLEKPFDIHIVLDATHASKEEIFNASQAIQKALNSANYHYNSVNINGNMIENDIGMKDELGYVKYALSFNKDTNLQLKDMKEVQ
ncbi:hypothetical protein H1Z61_07385 [Bacillus aquiflavi]|uniref:Uncharacterized protein n=1 Tax=Bacillus aquiflavi TaxID=2672567 RepID=A0A6B3W2G3_9BACI|nr:hypothetical protein [Bacillus aquiflavi]MBA4536971.1 hypothetical protein [Bacillus aquiflavi]NEY82667.1 hypothetical protein [Bacillus aquiflavi]UAC47784.1 hypothetical protein K6959_14345 [Bacillus aquiflavi]